MSERAKGWLQNAAILVLSLSAAFLLSKTPLFGTQSLLGGGETPSALSGAAAENAVAPVRMLFSNEYAHTGSDALTTADSAFESAGTFLGEAIGSAYGAARVDEAAFLSALEGRGVYFDFTVALPLELIAFWLGVNAPSETQLFAVRRCFLDASDSYVTLYLQDGEAGTLRFSTALYTASLADCLENAEGEAVEFAASLGEVYASLSPYTMVFSSAVERSVLASFNAAQELTTAGLLRAAEFNAHTASRYDESGTGALVVVEGLRTLRIAPDGTVSYQGDEAEAGSLYSAAESPGLTGAVSAARTLLNSVRAGATGAETLFVSGVERTDTGFVVAFDYMVDGTVVRFSDGASAASVTVDGATITAFTLRLRRYEATGDTDTLLPMRFCAAITDAQRHGRELSVAYVDSGGDELRATYLAS